MDDIIHEFLAETNESLNDLDISLVELEQNPGDRDLLSKIFRVMHTIKGTCGFLDLMRLGTVAHKAEDLLGLFRDGAKKPTPENIGLIFEALDQIKFLVRSIETEGKEPEGGDEALLARLEAACGDEGEEPSAEASPVAHRPPSTLPAASETAIAEGGGALQSLRVNVDVLEDLMTLVSELVLTRNQILQISRTLKDNTMSGSLQRLNHIVSDLQEGVMKTRMQPIGNAWSKLPRIVRDISSDLGKKINLEMLGQETELDRQVLEMIKDPLTHMVRNSADHGIEPPEERIAAGKAEAGTIRLNSYHEGGHIIIEIADDGKGLSLEKIRNKIIKNNLATAGELAAMSDQQVQQFIFAAGFSTAEQVTSVSGRGVGMDVVRTNIEKIGGSIEMKSVPGQGTTFSIKIPLTLAIISSLIVGADNERFAIPQLDVTELVMVGENCTHRIQNVNGTPILHLREKILPLICLKDLLQMGRSGTEDMKYVAVIKVGSNRFGLIVDKVYDTEEIVVKPVTKLMKKQSVFSGNTILGDGHVIMILDPSGIIKTTNIMARTSSIMNAKQEEAAEEKETKITPLLLFNAGDTTMKAVPLEHVSRLEEIDLSLVERAGNQNVIQYGDKLMPIYHFDARADLPATGRYPVIVFKTNAGLSGLVVDRILDITRYQGEYHLKLGGALEGSAIVQGKATDIINITHDRSQPDRQAANTALPTPAPYHYEAAE